MRIPLLHYKRWLHSIPFVFLALTLVLSACNQDSGNGSATGTAKTPATATAYAAPAPAPAAQVRTTKNASLKPLKTAVVNQRPGKPLNILMR